ncbi:uncharacterized protein N7525_004208 [Penicillium rubens]|uniref:uncharacterized protein n=1 Tax=Penicillium rubens TaxID=1108849 RepID=UPI002A5A6665|nr:uncharacterized protein N7525_004208 [Penicillium rubens]KAJ5839020.1 hypothetical protein N7525_004208 [Penicillium rubens]KAJ5867074.1 hypothetical protein N7534_001627 [Penicillium rubens]
MISTSGPAAGDTSSLCQFQGFALQMFPVADVLWTFAMALDTYLVVFHHFDTQSLRKLELKYIGVISTLSFIPAFVFLFIRGREKGPIYGDETIWCSIARSWMILRIIFYYAPVWLIIVIVLILYCLIGIEITRVRDEFKLSDDDHIALTSGNSASSVTTVEANSRRKPGFTPESTITSNTTEQDIEQDTIQRPYPPGRAPTTYQTPQQRRVSLRQYVIMPSLFFLAMLATWIAPTINRISEFVHRKHGTHSLLLAVKLKYMLNLDSESQKVL